MSRRHGRQRRPGVDWASWYRAFCTTREQIRTNEQATRQRRGMGWASGRHAHTRTNEQAARAAAAARYGLGERASRILHHTYLAMYWTGEWALAGKRLGKGDVVELEGGQAFDRGLHRQPLFFPGWSPRLMHRRPRRANVRKLREMPYHICWSLGSYEGLDPISRTVAAGAGPRAGGRRAIEDEKRVLALFHTHVCRLEVVEAACELDLGPELLEDLLVARTLFPACQLVAQLQHFVVAHGPQLGRRSAMTLQAALNALGHQHLVNRSAERLLTRCLLCPPHHALEGHAQGVEGDGGGQEGEGGEDGGWGPPPCWLEHTNKAELLDPLFNRLPACHYQVLLQSPSSFPLLQSPASFPLLQLPASCLPLPGASAMASLLPPPSVGQSSSRRCSRRRSRRSSRHRQET